MTNNEEASNMGSTSTSRTPDGLRGEVAGVLNTATKSCRNCGVEFSVPLWRLRENPNRGQFCSKACTDASKRTGSPQNARANGYRKRYLESNPLIAKAREAYRYALRTGKIARGTQCLDCSSTDLKLQGHHEDYSRPLDVIWLCNPCHRLRDEKRRERESAPMETATLV